MPDVPAAAALPWSLPCDGASEALLHERVVPWVERLPWQARYPVVFDANEGYGGGGVLGARAGPWDSVSFENLAHEIAHAIEAMDRVGPAALARPQWGLRTPGAVVVGRQVWFEPRTTQVSECESRVCAIQRRVLEWAGAPVAKDFFQHQARLLIDFLPDGLLGGANATQRQARRRAWMWRAYHAWPAERVHEGWCAAWPWLRPSA